MKECGFDVNNDRIHLPDEHHNEENVPGDIVHHWCVVLGEIGTGNLAVAAGHQPSVEDAVALDLEDPF